MSLLASRPRSAKGVPARTRFRTRQRGGFIERDARPVGSGNAGGRVCLA